MSKRVQIGLAAASVLAGLVWILRSPEAPVPYLRSVHDLHARLQLHPELGRASKLRVMGFIQEGSIRMDPSAGQVRFTMRDDPATLAPGLRVSYAFESPPGLPDLFAEGSTVV